jgi:hypothetical protein
MVNHLFNKGSNASTIALVSVGWFLFILGAVINDPLWLKLFLMSAARVLP